MGSTSLPASSRPHPVSCHLSSHSTLELLAPIQIQIRELPAEVDSVSETATNGPAFALPFQGQETGAKTVSPNTASRSRALNRCAQSSRSTAFENTHPAVCSADLASSRNTASISTPQTSQTLPLEVPARVPHKKDDQDSTQPHRVESIKSLGDFSFSSSSTCDAILHRHRMSLQRNIAAEYDFFNGLLDLRNLARRAVGGSPLKRFTRAMSRSENTKIVVGKKPHSNGGIPPPPVH